MTVTQLGWRVYGDELVSRADARGRSYYWMGGKSPGGVPERGTDIWAVANGYVSVTPVHLDMTAYHFREDLRRLNIQLS